MRLQDAMKINDTQLIVLFRIFLKLFKQGVKKGTYPVFLPDDIDTLDIQKINLESSKENAKNLKDGLYLLGRTIYHLGTGYSELNRESILLDGYPAIPSIYWSVLEIILSREEVSIKEIEKKLRHSENNPEEIIEKTKLIENNSLSETSQQIFEQIEKEFDRQINTLIQKEYHTVISASGQDFSREIELLRKLLPEIAKGMEENPIKERHIPILLVIKNDMVSFQEQIVRMEVDGKKGYTGISSDNLAKLYNIDSVQIPQGNFYLAIDIENGKEIQGKCPDDAKPLIEQANRSPLTTVEGLALITQCPEILKDHYIDLAGSRCGSARFVPSLRLGGGEGKPRLNDGDSDVADSRWGSASCGSRVGL